MKNLVAFYQTRDQAEHAKDDLINAGFDRDDVTLYDRKGKDEASVWESIKSAFGFADESDQQLYAEATRRGAVAVGLSFDHDAGEPSADEAIRILQRHNPMDLNRESTQWRQQGWAGQGTTGQAAAARSATSAAGASTGRAAATGAGTSRTAEGKEVIPVVEEQLQIGKQQIEQGGVRVHSRVTQKPVEAQVQLREEHVNVERRPVDRPVSDADTAFKDRTIEARQTSEQAVVAKQARVVEEVVVNKDVQQKTQTVRDTVRRTDVAVEQIQGQSTSHPGEDRVAGDFAREIATNQQYRGREWTTLEPEVRTSFERRYPNSKWEQVKDAVRREYDKVRSKV